MKETRLIDYKSFVITVIEDDVQKGLFFRNPIQKIFFDACGYSDSQSAQRYAKKVKNPIRRIYEILIGNGKIIKNIDSYFDDIEFGGFDANIICPPIYFKRKYRKLHAINTDNTCNIKEIKAFGYENPFNFFHGKCEKEVTTIITSNNKKMKLKERKGEYKFTYAYEIKNLIDKHSI